MQLEVNKNIIPTEFAEIASVLQVDAQLLGDYSVKAVSARELHRVLGIKKHFADWIRMQIERCLLVENADFERFSPKSPESDLGSAPPTKPTIEYNLTIDSAKKLALLSHTKAGNQVWNYFLYMERAAQKAFRGELPAATAPVAPSIPYGNSPKALARKELKEDWGDTAELLKAAGWSDGAIQGEFLADVKEKEMKHNVEIFSDKLKLIATANQAPATSHSQEAVGRIIEKGGLSRRVTWFAEKYSMKAKEINEIFMKLGWQINADGWKPVGLGKDFANTHTQLNNKVVIDGWKEYLVTPHLEKYLSSLPSN